MLLVKRRPAAFYGPAPAKPRGRDFAAEVASPKRSGFLGSCMEIESSVRLLQLTDYLYRGW
jgi:hypothetical protein